MNTLINIAKGLTAEISIIEGYVFVKTNYNGNVRTTSYESIQNAINETTLGHVKQYLQSI